MEFQAAKQHILQLLQNSLPKSLFYHGLHHTVDVFHAAREIAKHERIEGESLELLLTAALYHDSGFMIQYKNHEDASCAICRQHLPRFNYNEDQIDAICKMIMATKIPQAPTSHLAQILCDADLYYLGEDNFYKIGNTLYREFKEQGIISDEQEWNRLQVRFLESHSYYTQTAIAYRQPRKARHLAEVRRLVASYAA